MLPSAPAKRIRSDRDSIFPPEIAEHFASSEKGSATKKTQRNLACVVALCYSVKFGQTGAILEMYRARPSGIAHEYQDWFARNRVVRQSIIIAPSFPEVWSGFAHPTFVRMNIIQRGSAVGKFLTFALCGR